MKRDARLHGLSEDHHRALVLSRRLERAAEAGAVDGALVDDLAAELEHTLEPHFRIEEELLLPALRAAGLTDLAARLGEDHAAMRGLVAGAKAGATEHVAAFAARLREHVRFEERELFAACEASVPDDVLVEVERRAPHSRDR